MSSGPTIIFDKSGLQSLNPDEAVWLDAFFITNITPLFYVETLADLEKATRSGRTPEKIVGNLAYKTPDAGSYGWAQATVFGVTGDEYSLAQASEAVQDNYTPIWPDVWRYVNVPIDSDVRILVSLWDSDLVNDDPIGAPEINSTDLMNALTAQRKYEVRVDDQTDGQLLFIGISVVQQAGPM